MIKKINSQIFDRNLSVHSIPGFLVQLEWAEERIVETWVIEYLGGDSSDMNIYKAPLADDVVIVDACKSIYCSHRRWYRLDLLNKHNLRLEGNVEVWKLLDSTIIITKKKPRA